MRKPHRGARGVARRVGGLVLLGVAGGFLQGAIVLRAQDRARTTASDELAAGAARSSQVSNKLEKGSGHRFWDGTNLALFAGVATTRALDFTSTQHFRERGHSEVLLTNSIVDNRLLFAGIEVAGVAASVGLSYWLHRKGHHRLERWVSIAHVGVATAGDIHNYRLGFVHSGGPAP